MATPTEGPTGRRRKHGPKARGRTVTILNIMIAPEHKAALQALADDQGCSVSAVVRRFIDDGLATPVPDKSNSTPPDSN